MSIEVFDGKTKRWKLAFCISCGRIGEAFGKYASENDPPKLQTLVEKYNAKMNQIADKLRNGLVKIV